MSFLRKQESIRFLNYWTPAFAGVTNLELLEVPLREYLIFGQILLVAGSCATKDYKPRQVRKEATVVIPFVCRRGAWLSTGSFRKGGQRLEVKG